MEEVEFTIKEGTEFIELIKLLKVKGIAQTGGHAKIMIEEGSVIVNGEQEFRKRRKLKPGDTIDVEGVIVKIKQL